MNAPGKEIEMLTEGMNWDRFKNLWEQTCAWIPKTRNNMKISTVDHNHDESDSESIIENL